MEHELDNMQADIDQVDAQAAAAQAAQAQAQAHHPDLWQTLQELHAELHNINGRLNQMDAAWAQAHHATAAHTPAPVHTPPPIPVPIVTPLTTTRVPEVRVARPTVFDGARDKTRSFLAELELTFRANHQTYADHEARIAFALSYMKGGTAGPWAELMADFQFGSWQVFRHQIEAKFGDPRPELTAQFKLSTTRQGGKTADEYIAEFQEQAARSLFNDQALVSAFQKGLNAPLVEHIYAMVPMPETLQDWTTAASLLDRQYRQAQQVKRANASGMTTTSHVRPSTTSRTVQSQTVTTSAAVPARVTAQFPSPVVARPPVDPMAMDVDSGRNRRFRTRTFSGNCFTCGKPGHRAAQCTEQLRQAVRAVLEQERRESAVHTAGDSGDGSALNQPSQETAAGFQ